MNYPGAVFPADGHWTGCPFYFGYGTHRYTLSALTQHKYSSQIGDVAAVFRPEYYQYINLITAGTVTSSGLPVYSGTDFIGDGIDIKSQRISLVPVNYDTGDG